MKCKICCRETQISPQSPYCKLHQKAYENVLSKLEVWKQALEIEWGNYLNEIVRNPFTGIWAREVAENLLSEQEQGLHQKECLNHYAEKSLK